MGGGEREGGVDRRTVLGWGGAASAWLALGRPGPARGAAAGRLHAPVPFTVRGPAAPAED